MRKLKVMVGSEDLGVWEQVADFLESKGIGLTRVRSVKEACETLEREDVLLLFCENRLIDGTYEDLLNAAKEVRADVRIVVSPASGQPELSLYSKARELGAFAVLRKSYSVKDIEWLVICALREQKFGRPARTLREYA